MKFLSMVVVLMMTSLGAQEKGELQDVPCPELPVQYDWDYQACLTPLSVNTSINSTSSTVDLNGTDKSTGHQISLMDTGYTSRETYESLSFAIIYILIPFTSVLGLVGNILSLVTLVKQKPRDTITIYLICLCLADCLTMLCSMIVSTERIISRFNALVGFRVRVFSFWSVEVFGIHVATRISSCITVILSIERLIAVKLPFVVKQKFLSRHPWKVALAIGIVVICAFMPNFFRFDVSIRTNPVTNQSYLSVVNSQFAESFPEFNTYFTIAVLTLTRVLAMVIVLVCNLVIIDALRASVQNRKRISSNAVNENKTSRLLLAISAIFLICTTPGTIHVIVSMLSDNYGPFQKEYYLFESFNSVSLYLDLLNSAVNFIVYMLSGTSFRENFFKVWGCQGCKGKQRHTDIPSETKRNGPVLQTI